MISIDINHRIDRQQLRNADGLLLFEVGRGFQEAHDAQTQAFLNHHQFQALIHEVGRVPQGLIVPSQVVGEIGHCGTFLRFVGTFF